ncbi:MAG: short-chain dehydrogenase [Bacteroidetes bacterium GWF2_38_335]|nr:MAG: short-chain dehydrogenase [Bacteroidetes bacterium GWF2_38_335]OFY79662.1 MAG: short-chain dehydrogenase [Bacteroidetes bacterium RIFOXYA12_FULL_38_20]HBS89015.1 short-chain dehydrogenase [Bacteroidales bacterium]
MKPFRNIQKIYNPPPFHWVGNGFKVHNFFPRAIESNDRMSPFFLLDYNAKIHYPPSNEKRGVGVHPHRGLETVTIAYHGKVAHHDSAGNGGVISAGDVQWMTAGKGILHKEYQEDSYVKKGGDFQMVQLWVNLPAEHKMTEPAYQEIPASKMGKFTLPGQSGFVNVIAGEYMSVKGPAHTFTPINLFDIRLEKGASADFEINPAHNTSILVIEGNVEVNESKVAGLNQLVLFENAGQHIKISASEKAIVLLMSGEPINEPVYSHGPFLMNTREEIIKAWEDYENGFFGELED